MAFESAAEHPRENLLNKLAAALNRRRMIPSKFLLVGVDHTRSTPDYKCFAMFYDRDAHQRAHDADRAIPAPVWADNLRSFVEGFLARG